MAGTVLFRIEGATAAIGGNLDLLGLIVLAFSMAVGGGILRDLLIGDVPPAALRDWRYAVSAFFGGALVFSLHRYVEGIPAWLLVLLDAAGLSFFAIAGTEKALLYKMHPFIAIILGGVTGGTIRDLFLARIPTVWRANVYATAALAGSAIKILGRKLRVPAWSALFGGVACFLLRVVSVWLHWNLPRVIER